MAMKSLMTNIGFLIMALVFAITIGTGVSILSERSTTL